MAANFPSTRWSLIARASSESPVGSRALMGELLSRYWRPIVVHLHYKGLNSESAEDVAQDFIIELLDQNLLSIADPAKGRFRSLLLTALDHFFVSRLRYERAARRSPGRLSSLDAAEIDQPGSDNIQAPLVFERAWALDVLAEALSRMEQESIESGDPARWQIFQERIVLPLFTSAPETEYSVLAKRFGLGTEKAAMNVLVTAKRQFARVLREVIREYVTRMPAADQAEATGRPSSTGTAVSHGGDVDLREHQIRQEVEREIDELQQVLSQSRAVADLVGEVDEESDAADAAKERFWRLLTTHDLESNPWSVLFRAGTEMDEQSLIAAFEEALRRPLNRVPGCTPATDTTIGQVLRSDDPDLETLQTLKGWFNVQRFSPARDVPAPLANGLYLLVLAVALRRCGRRITGLADPQFSAGLEWLADQPWLSADLRPIVVAAHGMLSP